MGNITTGIPGGYYYYSLKVCGSLSVLLEARCQGFSVSDGRPAARGAQEEIRAAGGGSTSVGAGVLSLQSLCSSQLERLVM